MEVLVLFLLPLPLVLLIILVLLIKKYKKETRLERLYRHIGMYGEVIDTVDKYNGAVIIEDGGKEVIIFCHSYGSKIHEGTTVLITEYDFVEKIFKVECAPRKIYRT